MTLLSAYEDEQYQSTMIGFSNTYSGIKDTYFTLFGDNEDFKTSGSFVTARPHPSSHIWLKVPQISNFKADIIKWQTFRDMFDVLVHNENYSKIQKI